VANVCGAAKKKTVEELDAEMADYFPTVSGGVSSRKGSFSRAWDLDMDNMRIDNPQPMLTRALDAFVNELAEHITEDLSPY
jgi:hypothetical protein